MLCIIASYHCMQFQEKLMHKTCENYKNTSSGTNFCPYVPNLGPEIKENYWSELEKMVKNLFLCLILAHLAQIRPAFFFFFFKNLAPWVTRYHGQLSLCTISEKTNDPIFRKLSDRWREGQTDEQTDESDFIGCCLTKVKHPTK